MPRLYQKLYSFLLTLCLPFFLLRLYWRGRKLAAYRARWQERLGLFKSPKRPGGIWVHAVSMGEVVAALPLIRALLEQHSDKLIVMPKSVLQN